MKEQLILVAKVLGFAFLTILLSRLSVYSSEADETVLYWFFNVSNSVILTYVGFKAFSKN